MTNYLIVIDAQNDFLKSGPLAINKKEADRIIHHIDNMIDMGDYKTIFTRDTHRVNQFTIETQSLPQHCIEETPGWCIIDEFQTYVNRPTVYKVETIINKYSYGYLDWKKINDDFVFGLIGSITLVGVCTDICVISNALILRSLYPDIPIIVDAAGCAGTTPENHEKALDIMEKNGIEIINRGEV